MIEKSWTPVINQHATCVAVNPVQGCPKACAYCFLNERGLTAVRPEVLVEPAAVVEMLLASPFYRPDRVLALYTWTDVMATRTTRAHLLSLLQELQAQHLPNAITLITKCFIPDAILEALVAARHNGLRLIVYLSYSGLGAEIEHGVNHKRLCENFARLKQADIPIIHYWRPAFPTSAIPDVMERVLRLASTHAHCSIVAGLKLGSQARERLMTFWPALREHPEAEDAEGVFPQAFWSFVHHPPEWASTYPLFHTNSCALAYVLGETDRFAIYNSSICTDHNRCPDEQRQHCQASLATRPALQASQVAALLQKFGYGTATFEIDSQRREVHVATMLPTNVVAALTQELIAKVDAPRSVDDTYWRSGTAGAQPLILS